MGTPDRVFALGARLGLDAAVIGAVFAVECPGAGVIDGYPVIRLEVHELWRHATAATRPGVDRQFLVTGYDASDYDEGGHLRPTAVSHPWKGHLYRVDPTAPWVRIHQPGTVGQALERTAYAAAKMIDPGAAVQATSFGLGQILGSEYGMCGFGTPSTFEAAQATEAGQIETFGRYVEARKLVPLLRARDWYGFARAFNGPGKPDDYAARLAHEYARRGGT